MKIPTRMEKEYGDGRKKYENCNKSRTGNIIADDDYLAVKVVDEKEKKEAGM